MSEPGEIAVIEAQLARDIERLEKVQQQKVQLMKDIPHLGFRAVPIGIRLRVEVHALSDIIFKNSRRIANLKK